MTKRHPPKGAAAAAIDWIVRQRKTGSSTAARQAYAFVSAEIIERSPPAGPIPRDVRHAIAIGCSMSEIHEMRRRGQLP